MVDNKGLIREIICLTLFLIIVIPICVNASNSYNDREDYLRNCEEVFVDIHNNDKDVSDNVISSKIITITNGNQESVRVSLIFKIAKFTNSYTLKLGDKSYRLDELDYTEDNDYLYYNLGLFVIDKVSNMDFYLVLNDGISYDSSVSYSFLVEGM